MRPACLLLAASLAWPAAAAFAGPPFVTDDPQPTDRGHWEIYNFVNATHVAGSTAGEAGFDLNYGAAEDIQLTLVLPAAYEDAGGLRVRRGTVEAAAKFKLLHQRPGSALPDLAVFPRLFLPTAGRGLGSDRASLLLPVWLQKDAGPWSVFGGGGYQINPGPGERDFWQDGVAVTRRIGRRLTVGAEVFHRTRDTTDGRAFTQANLGLIWRLADHWSLLAATGPGLENAASEGRYDAYLALEATY
jgi:hypothetical protein